MCTLQDDRRSRGEHVAFKGRQVDAASACSFNGCIGFACCIVCRDAIGDDGGIGEIETGFLILRHVDAGRDFLGSCDLLDIPGRSGVLAGRVCHHRRTSSLCMHLAAIHLDVQLTITKDVEGDGLTRGGKLASFVLSITLIGQISAGMQVLEIDVSVLSLFKLPNVHCFVLSEAGTNLHGEVGKNNAIIASCQVDGHRRFSTIFNRVGLRCAGGLIDRALITKG